MRSVTAVFLHSRLERTPMGNWMWFFCNADGVPGLWNVGRTFVSAEIIDSGYCAQPP
jgi:hypothetical protein